MARDRSRSRLATSTGVEVHSLSAAAARVDNVGGKGPSIYGTKYGLEWQREAYRHYTICGEARYAARFMGNAVSRADLFIQSAKGERVENGPSVAYLNSLFDGDVGQTQMLEDIAIHLTIAGECYLIGRVVNGKDVWEVVSILEIEVDASGVWRIQYNHPQYADVVLSNSDAIIRIWTPRPGRRKEADSPFRSLLPVLSEIEWSTRHIFAQLSSRLAGAGLLFLPQNMTFPPAPDQDGEQLANSNEATQFLKMLADAMMAPLKNPELPSALVPITVTAPAEAIDKARLMQFWTELDSKALEIRNDGIDRFADGMDLPREQIRGMSSNSGSGGGSSNGVSHWGAWQIEESTIKMHIEPMLDVIVACLTLEYLRKLVSNDDKVAYSTAALRLRPDRSKESIELYNLGLLKGEVVVVENGFDPEDMPDDEELAFWLLKKVAGGSATPEQVGYALRQLGVEVPVAPVEEAPTKEIAPRESRPDPSLEDHPSRPRTPEESALIYACDAMVWRALELAGKRAINAGVRGKNRDRTIEPTRFHMEGEVSTDPAFLLDGVFAYGQQILGDEWDSVSQALQDYCSVLITTQTEHTREHLTEFLVRRGLFTAAATAVAQQPIAVTVNVAGAEHAFNVNLPEGMVSAPEVTVNPVNHFAPKVNMPEVKVDVQSSVIPAPQVTVENSVGVAPTPVTIENRINPTPVTVENNIEVDPTPVNVAAPNVTVSPNIEVTAEVVPPPKRKTQVLRDKNDKIIGTEGV